MPLGLPSCSLSVSVPFRDDAYPLRLSLRTPNRSPGWPRGNGPPPARPAPFHEGHSLMLSCLQIPLLPNPHVATSAHTTDFWESAQIGDHKCWYVWKSVPILGRMSTQLKHGLKRIRVRCLLRGPKRVSNIRSIFAFWDSPFFPDPVKTRLPR